MLPDFFAEICHGPDEIYQRCCKVRASLVEGRGTRGWYLEFFGNVGILIGLRLRLSEEISRDAASRSQTSCDLRASAGRRR